MADSKKSLFTRPQTPSSPVIGPDIDQFVRGTDIPQETTQASSTTTLKTAQAQKEKPKEEPLKRLTIDIPLGLHKRVKAGCAAQETTIAEVVREILERKFPEPKAT